MKTLRQFTTKVREEIYDTLMFCRSCIPKSLNLLKGVISHKLLRSSSSEYVRFRKFFTWLVCRSNRLSFAYCLECYLFAVFQEPFPGGMKTFFKTFEKCSGKTSLVSLFWCSTIPLLSSPQRCSVKKVFLEISQNSQEKICARVSFLINLQAWDDCFCKGKLVVELLLKRSLEFSICSFVYYIRSNPQRSWPDSLKILFKKFIVIFGKT